MKLAVSLHSLDTCISFREKDGKHQQYIQEFNNTCLRDERYLSLAHITKSTMKGEELEIAKTVLQASFFKNCVEVSKSLFWSSYSRYYFKFQV